MLLSSRVIVFLLGFYLGFVMYLLTFGVTDTLKKEFPKQAGNASNFSRKEYESWIRHKGFSIVNANLDDLSYSEARNDLKKGLESQLLFDEVHVTCVVFVERPKNAYLIDNTWGKKCNSLVFYSKFPDNFIQTNVINYVNKWQYLCDSLRDLWEKKDPKQWFLFSPDDVFAIPENVRYLVAAKDYNSPYYFGHNVVFWQQLFNSDKTSFVLSKGALELLMTKFTSSSDCLGKGQKINNGVYNLGKYLSVAGVKAGDSRDEKGRERFHIFTFEQLTSEEDPQVIARNSKTSLYPIIQGKDCCSDTSISFRSVQNDKVYLYFYLLYNVKVFLRGHAANRNVKNFVDDEAWKKFAHEDLGKNASMTTISAAKYYDLWRSKVYEPEEFNKKIRQESLKSPSGS